MATPGQIPLFGNPNKVIKTVANIDLLQLSVGKNLSVGPLDPNIKWILYVRALKVFRMSFAGYDQISPDHYNKKYAEYRYNMGQLYNIDINDPSLANIDAIISGHLETEKYITKISMLRLRTPAPIPYISVQTVENYSDTQQERTVHQLNPVKEEQRNVNITRYHSYRSYVERRLDDTRGIRLSVQTPSTQFGTFDIRFCHISTYGFRDWIQFSHGVELFVEIEVSGYIEEQGSTDEFIYYFHMQTLYEMLNERLNHWRNNIQLFGLKCEPEHRNDSQKYQIVIVKSAINPNTTEAYWPDSQSQPGIVELWDLQTAYIKHNKTIDSVCLCDRWCNWTAFFHYSPIYRFLLLCHKQFYLKNWTHIPEMYVMVSAFCTTLRGQRMAPTDQLPPTPVYRLLNNAIDYKKQYSLIIRSNQFSLYDYRLAIPVPRDMLGLAYNILRFETDWVAQVHQLYDNHFTRECVDTFCQLGQAFTELHGFVAEIINFVYIQYHRKEWRKEFNQIVRNHCLKYQCLGCNRIDQQNLVDIDWMFGEDFKYSKSLPKTPTEQLVWNMRSMVLRNDGQDRNPLMVSAQVSPLLNIFCTIYRFNGWTESLVPTKLESDIEAVLAVQHCLYLDQLFENHLTNVQPAQWMTYQLIGQQLLANGVQHMEHQLMIVYMLRIYHMAYEWQRQTIVSMESYNDFRDINDRSEPSIVFDKIFDFGYIEHHYRDIYQNRLFVVDINQLNTNFNAFYGNYWRKPAHETNPLLNIIQIEQSVIGEYNKLYHWWNYQGDQRTKFLRIVNWIGINIENVRQNSRQIFDNHMLPIIIELSATAYEYSVDILDYLVYYLVKAQCFAIVCIANKFLSKMASLETEALIKSNKQFLLCKPGWVPMFRTIDTMWAALDSILVDSIIYDDECQRIAGTVEETKQMIKRQYRQYYEKMSIQWIRELRLLRLSQPTANTSILISLHLAVGLGFVAAFTNTFRFKTRSLWLLLAKVLALPVNPHKPQQSELQNRRPVCIQYLQDLNTVLEAVPLIRHPWYQELAPVLTVFANSIQQLGINLDESNF